MRRWGQGLCGDGGSRTLLRGTVPPVPPAPQCLWERSRQRGKTRLSWAGTPSCPPGAWPHAPRPFVPIPISVPKPSQRPPAARGGGREAKQGTRSGPPILWGGNCQGWERGWVCRAPKLLCLAHQGPAGAPVPTRCLGGCQGLPCPLQQPNTALPRVRIATLAPGATSRTLPPPPNTIGDPAPPPSDAPTRPSLFKGWSQAGGTEGGREDATLITSLPIILGRCWLSHGHAGAVPWAGQASRSGAPVSPWTPEGWPRHTSCPLPTFAEGSGGSSPYSSPQRG